LQEIKQKIKNKKVKILIINIDTLKY